MKSFEDLYMKLNPQQKQAVDTIDGPVFVVAGPGTGKTQILTLRIANILKKGSGVDPENILALTFTNAAAFNMRERLGKIVGPELAHRVYISTFHSFAEGMIQRYPEYFPRFDGARLVSNIEQIELLERLTNEHGGEPLSAFKRRNETITSLAAIVSKLKSLALHPDEVRKKIAEDFEEQMSSEAMYYKVSRGTFKKGDLKVNEVRNVEKRRDKNLALVNVYEAYEQALRDSQLYDYNDLITSIVDELRGDSQFQAELQETFQYILVDEHQDTNDGQNAILYALIDNPVWEGKPNVFVVGDAKQSIFRFAGASQKSFTELFDKLRDVTAIELEHNYRSHQKVLDYATSLIKKSSYHESEPVLTAFSQFDGEISYRSFSNYKMETLWVARNIQDQVKQGEDIESIAVLVRNNRDLADLRILFDVYGITYRDYSKKNILEDIHLLKLFLLLQAIHDPQNDEMMGKVLFIDFLAFPIISIQKVLLSYRNKKKITSIFEFIANQEALAGAGLSETEQKQYLDFSQKMQEQVSLSHNLDLLNFFSQFIREIGYLKATLSRPDSVVALSSLETFFDELQKESLARTSFSFDDFIVYLSTLKKYRITMNMKVPMQKGVSLMTYHGSKGLEFDTVYMIRSMKKGSVPREFNLSLDEFSDGDSEDERRLTYVALTRAKKNCFISSHQFNENGKEQSRSFHIDEIDELPHVDMTLWEQESTGGIVDFFGASQQKLPSLIDKEFLKERFFDSKLSVSALNNYLESPLLYFFRNLVLLPEAKRTSLEFGSFLHKVLELFFKESLQQGSVQDLPKLLEILEEQASLNVVYEEFKDHGMKVLTAYWEYYGGNFELPLQNELRINAMEYETRDGYQLNLSGAVDKITIDEDGSITVWDYKTGKAWGQLDRDRKEKIKRQAVFYKLLLQQAFGGKYNFKRAVFDFLEPNQDTGEFERKEFFIEPEDITQLHQEIEALVQDIVEGTLLEHSFQMNDYNRDLLEFLEVLQGPRSYEQPSLLG
jgi:DNA helicase-2/ATP-dependent DNA helicase PcrA